MITMVFVCLVTVPLTPLPIYKLSSKVAQINKIYTNFNFNYLRGEEMKAKIRNAEFHDLLWLLHQSLLLLCKTHRLLSSLYQIDDTFCGQKGTYKNIFEIFCSNVHSTIGFLPSSISSTSRWFCLFDDISKPYTYYPATNCPLSSKPKSLGFDSPFSPIYLAKKPYIPTIYHLLLMTYQFHIPAFLVCI